MKILYYQTNHAADAACKNAMQALGAGVETFTCPLQNQEQEERFLPLIRQLIREQAADAVYSFGFISALSQACEEEQVLYISWCCDAPTMAPFAEGLTNGCNRILTVDSAMVEVSRARGVAEVYYLPLAPVLGSGMAASKAGQTGRISFVGRLHRDNLYRHFSKLPDTARGYLDGITTVQVHVYGYSLFGDLMGDAFWESLMKQLSIGQASDDKEKYKYMIENFFLAEQTTRLERELVIKRLGAELGELFSACSPELGNAIPYGEKLAAHYAESAINLNITNRARVSGIPQQAWDILNCGGFLISNYQADYEGLLEPGKDFVVYESVSELVELVQYYSRHPQDRLEIAQNGQKKVREGHSWLERAGAILSLLENGRECED